MKNCFLSHPCRFGSCASLLWLGTMAVRADLDLSPQVETYELEQVKMSQLVFRNDGQAKPTYQPPLNWKYSGGADHLELQPGGLAQAKASITKWPATPLTFDPEGLKRLTEQVVGLLPKGSEQVKVLSEEMNPLQIDGKQTYLVELSYIYYGEHFASYALLLDRGPEPLCFRLTCRETNYAALREAFHRSLFTWQNL